MQECQAKKGKHSGNVRRVRHSGLVDNKDVQSYLCEGHRTELFEALAPYSVVETPREGAGRPSSKEQEAEKVRGERRKQEKVKLIAELTARKVEFDPDSSLEDLKKLDEELKKPKDKDGK